MADSSIDMLFARGKEDFINEGNGRMNLFDTRLYRRLVMYNEQMKDDNESNNLFYPHFDYGSYVMDFHETPTSVQRMIEETNEINQPKVKQGLEKRKEYIDFIKELNVFTEKQPDIYNIRPHGLQKIVLLKE